MALRTSDMCELQGNLPLALLRCMRPMSSLVAGLMTSSVFWARDGFSFRSMIAGLAMWMLTGFGFVINDILDYRKDSEAGIDRPIARGLLTRKTALSFAAGLALAIFALSLWVGSGGGILAATGLALILYTPSAQRLPLIKGVFVATLCMAPLYYGSVVCNAHYSWPLYLFMTAFVVGREALMDADELRGDLRAGLITIAAILGCARTKRIGIAIMALSLAGIGVVAGRWVAKAAAAAALVSLMTIFGWPRLHDAKRIELSRIPMLAAVLAIACG